MIVLLTGKPGSGKSTVAERFIHAHPNARWVVTKSIPRDDGWRAGFEAHRYDGTIRVVSHKTDIHSDVIIGKNHVDLQAVEDMFGNVLQQVGSSTGLAIIDEIGPIQLLSSRFASALEHALNGNGPLLATIHYTDERLAKYRDDHRHIVITVNQANRDNLPEVLATLFSQGAEIDQIAPNSRRIVSQLLQSYIDSSATIQLRKLLSNAIPYVAHGKVQAIQHGVWSVTGNHGAHTVSLSGNSLVCDCDLFTGQGKYHGNPGECSHIQAIKITQL